MEILLALLFCLFLAALMLGAFFCFLFFWHMLAESAGHGFRKGWDMAGKDLEV